jgi:N-acetyl-gamma-glutamyl-phosphate reductase
MNENAYAYSVSKHRHLAEIIENLEKISGKKFAIQFTPQIIPVTRGIISTIYIKSNLSAQELKSNLADFYNDSHFVRIYPDAIPPNLKAVTGTNFCDINIYDSHNSDFKIIVSCIDNLTKGSSGQAIQNFNLIFSLPEQTGLTFQTLYP